MRVSEIRRIAVERATKVNEHEWQQRHASLLARLNAIASEGQRLLADVRTGNGSLSKLLYSPDFYNQAVGLEKRVDDMLAAVQGGRGTAGKLLNDPALYDEAQKTIVEIRGLVAQINSKKSTVGSLINDDTLARHLDELMGRFNSTLDKINSGQGTLGQFMVNPQLYDSLTGATREFQSLAKDMRANPKKFLTIRLTLF